MVFYVVKWNPRGFVGPVVCGRRFDTVAAALLEVACALLEKGPDDVWIENGAGVKIIGAAEIAEYCPPLPHRGLTADSGRG